MSVTCPQCGKVLASAGGLEVHESITHPEGGGEETAPLWGGSIGGVSAGPATTPLMPTTAPTDGGGWGGHQPAVSTSEPGLASSPVAASPGKVLAIALAALLAVGLVAVGASRLGSGSGPSPLVVVTRAAARTAGARTAQVSETIHITPGPNAPPGAGALTDVHADGAIDFADRRGALNFDVAGQSVQAILDGSAIYENLPQLSQITGGKPWLKLDIDALGKLAGINGLGSLAQGSYSDPSQGLQYLAGASGPVTTLGTEDVRGVATTHYRLTVSLAVAAARVPPAQQAVIQQIIDQFGVASVPTDVWIDHAGLARRVQETYDYSHARPLPNLPAGSLPSSAEVTLELYGFGVPVTAQAPAADQVTDLSQILTQLQSGSGSGTATPASDALPSRLLRVLPAGYVQQPDSVGDTGPSDLDKAVRDDGSADARQALTSDGFVAGYQRLWQKGASDQIIDFVYQFASQGGAATYLSRTEGGSPAGARPFAVPSVPGAQGFAISNSQGAAVVVFLVRGHYLAQVIVHGADATPALATSLAQQQYRLLAP